MAGESHSKANAHRAFWKEQGGPSVVRAHLRDLQGVRYKGPVPAAPSAPREASRTCRALGGCIPWLLQRRPRRHRLSSPANLFPSLDPSRSPAGPTPGRSARRAPSQNLQVQGWGQRLQLRGQVHLPAGSRRSQRGSGLCASASARSPALRRGGSRARGASARDSDLLPSPGKPGRRRSAPLRPLGELGVHTMNALGRLPGRGRSHSPAQLSSGSFPRGLRSEGPVGQLVPRSLPLAGSEKFF